MATITSSHAGRRIRTMGCHEAYQLAMHTYDQYRGTIVACRYILMPSLTCAESLQTLKSRFCNALARVVLAQPHLHVGIIDENTKNPAFVCLDHLDLRNHVQWISLDDSSQFQQKYLDTMQAQLDSRYENLPTQPGWRVVAIHKIGAPSIEVLYVWNHTHHDGSSGKIFHQYLLQYLNDSVDQDQAPIVDVSEDAEKWILKLPDPTDTLPPNPEILTSWTMSPGLLLSELWTKLKPQFLFPPNNIHARWAPNQATPYETRFMNFTVDSQLVTKLVAACRLHNTTITGLVQALCLVSLSTGIKDAAGFASRTPYDLRKILPSNTNKYPWLQPKEAMCNYVSVIDHEFGPELVNSIRSRMTSKDSESTLSEGALEIVWSVAARVRREIQARLDSGTHNDLIAVMKLCPDWNSEQQSELRRTRYLSWLVTNLGILDGESGGESSATVTGGEAWSLGRAELILSAETPSAALSVSIMTVKDREMCVTCSWQDCVVKKELGERLMGDLNMWLNDIGS